MQENKKVVKFENSGKVHCSLSFEASHLYHLPDCATVSYTIDPHESINLMYVCHFSINERLRYNIYIYVEANSGNVYFSQEKVFHDDSLWDKTNNFKYSIRDIIQKYSFETNFSQPVKPYETTSTISKIKRPEFLSATIYEEFYDALFHIAFFGYLSACETQYSIYPADKKNLLDPLALKHDTVNVFWVGEDLPPDDYLRGMIRFQGIQKKKLDNKWSLRLFILEELINSQKLQVLKRFCTQHEIILCDIKKYNIPHRATYDPKPPRNIIESYVRIVNTVRWFVVGEKSLYIDLDTLRDTTTYKDDF